jgi:DNA-binding transcriptional LysR family regulator
MAEITLRHLRYLLAVAGELHFRRAAERLHLTQPALSHQIRQLEEVVGVRLLDRDGRSVSLTRAGESLVDDARQILATVDRALVAARRAATEAVTVRICHSPSVARIMIPRLIHRLGDADPVLDALWLERSEEAVGADLRAGRYDLVLGRFALTESGLEHEVLLWERPGVYLRCDDPLAELAEIPLSALAGRRVRTVRRESVPQHYEVTTNDLRAAGLQGQVESGMSYGNWASEEMRLEILEDRCVVIGLASADGTLEGVRVLPLAAPASPIPLTLSWRSGETRREVRAFIELTRKVASELVEPWVAPAP